MLFFTKYFFISIIIFSNFLSKTCATEVDNFTLRYGPFSESLEILNEEINHRLDLVINSLNNNQTGDCSEKYLISKMAPQFLHEVRGRLEDWMYIHPYADVKRQELKDSIYFDFPFLYLADQMLGDHTIGDISNLGKIAGLIKVNGVILGTDKLGHFFDEGLEQYNILKKSNNILEAIKYGQKTETGIFGFYTTGVKSFSDQIANFQGMRFWATLLGNGIDDKEISYLTCDRGIWQKQRDFDFSNYIDSALDEGINCNEYKNLKIETKITSRLQYLADTTGENFTCPISFNECQKLQKKYSGDLRVLLHPKCR